MTHRAHPDRISRRAFLAAVAAGPLAAAEILASRPPLILEHLGFLPAQRGR